MPPQAVPLFFKLKFKVCCPSPKAQKIKRSNVAPATTGFQAPVRALGSEYIDSLLLGGRPEASFFGVATGPFSAPRVGGILNRCSLHKIGKVRSKYSAVWPDTIHQVPKVSVYHESITN